MVVGQQHVLPASTLQNRTLGSQMGHWQMPDGSTVRCERVQVFCINCGKPYGWVPDFTTFSAWQCRECHERWGTIAGTYSVPEDEFNQAVAFEIRRRFGKDLTVDDLAVVIEEGRLGTALEKLAMESPYKVWEG